MENNKQTIILSGIAIVALLALIIGATFAYFQATSNNGSNTNVNVTTYTSDLLTFEVGNDILVYADQTSFASGKGNATGSTFAKAVLTANNKTNSATEHYYTYLNISNNTFTYSQNTSTPELLLTIKDASGNAITSISGLTYKTVTDGKGASISGFDITTKNGLVTLFDNREITASPSKAEEWNITVTFVNYNVNQKGNAGKSFNAKLMIQQEEYKLPTLTEYVISQYTGTQGDNGIYYHDSSLTNGAGDNSYRYAGANPNNFVCFGSDVSPCPSDNLYRIIGVIDGKVKLIKYDYATSVLLGEDGDYYGSGTPNATYYKGSLTTIDKYYWNNDAGTNTWSTSLLNKTNLNTNFINNIGSTWANKIATTTWKVGGNTYSNIYSKTPSVAYTNEITNPDPTNSTDNATTYSAKIGLMYVSDYGFAADPSAWTLTMGSYNNTTATSTNWMYMGYYEWTILRNISVSDRSFVVDLVGVVYSYGVSINFGVRPSFNLESSTTYVSGSGSMSDPMRLS